MDIVLDASVAIKWFKDKDEDYVDSALCIQEKKLAQEIEIIVPDLFFLEVLHVFLQEPAFTRQDIATIKESLVRMDMKVIYPESKILGETINMAITNHLTFYDAFYMAAANINHADLYTEDKHILSCSKDYDFIRHIKDF